MSGSAHRNGSIGGNGGVSPKNQTEVAKKRLSDQSSDAAGKKRKVVEGERPITQVI